MRDTWRTGFHLMPPTGWLNDPNGLCQFRGTYHVFHQYSPDWPDANAARGWGHYVSDDLVTWRHLGMAVAPDTPDEASGSYSGCAVVVPGAASDGGDLLRLYYTGNVKEPGVYDYVLRGRRATQILVESEDGVTLGEKRVLLRNADYPPFCTLHVRDPKVWREAGSWWMLLGARDRDDRGLALVMRSDDGVAWGHAGTVRADGPLGYMWECPDRIELGGRTWLSLCPQGMREHPLAHGMRDVSGYVALPEGSSLALGGTLALDGQGFRLWDHGFDFYAPQSFVDERGRTILVGWMGMPEAPWQSAPGGLDWCHCLTVPRELSPGDGGHIRQRPVSELEGLRGPRRELAPGSPLVLGTRRADIELSGVGEDLALDLNGAVRVSVTGAGRLRVAFLDATTAAGRGAREVPCEGVRSLRVLVDDSALEVFVNDGEEVLSTRWFPRERGLVASLSGSVAEARAWEMVCPAVSYEG